MVKPVDQTRLYSPDKQLPPGNCFIAAMASLLEVPIEEIPDEIKYWIPGKGHISSWLKWWPDLVEYLATKQLRYLEVKIEQEHLTFNPLDILELPFIASGISPRDPSVNHAVVGHYVSPSSNSYKFELLHDPHPSRDGLAGDPSLAGFLIPMR